MGMAADTIGFMAVGVAVLAFLWTLHREIGALRQEMHRDIGGLREDMNRDIGGLREDMNRDIGALRQEMRRDIGGLREDVSDLRDRVSRVEGMLAGAGLKVGPESAAA